MAICTAAELKAPCFLNGPLSPNQQKAALVYLMALELAALGGTDYRSGLSTTLLSDAAALTCGMDEPHRIAAIIKIEMNNAETAGASLPNEIEATNAVICLSEADPEALDEAYVLLMCKLGVHASQAQ